MVSDPEMIEGGEPGEGRGHDVGKRIVLTGGASQLTGLPDTARRILARNVRVGRPLGVSGLPAAAKGPAFSTAVGRGAHVPRHVRAAYKLQRALARCNTARARCLRTR